MRAIQTLLKRDIKEVRGIVPTKAKLPDGTPMIMLPTRGKYLLPEIKIINDIITSIEPVDIVEECAKINYQVGMDLMVVMKHPDNPRLLLTMVKTPIGQCVYLVQIETNNLQDIAKEVHEIPVDVEIDEDMKDKFQIM